MDTKKEITRLVAVGLIALLAFVMISSKRSSKGLFSMRPHHGEFVQMVAQGVNQ